MSRETDWGDPDTSKEFGTDAQRYRGREKFKDVIRIITKPIKYFTHSVKEKKLFVNCSKVEGRCLFCDENYDRALKIGCVVVHIAEREVNKNTGNYSEVGEAKVWLFGKDKWKSLSGIIEDYEQIKNDSIQKHDLIVTCDDETFQKIELRPTLVKSKVRKDMLVSYPAVKKQLEYFTSPTSLEKQKEILGGAPITNHDTIETENAISIEESLDIPDELSEGDRAIRKSLNEHEKEDKKEKGDTVEDILDELDMDIEGGVPF